MATKKPKKRVEKTQLMLNDDELEAIDNWRFEHRLPSRAAAMRALIRRGLEADIFDEPATGPDVSSREFSIVGDTADEAVLEKDDKS